MINPRHMGNDFGKKRFMEECPGAKMEDGMTLQLAAAHRGSQRIIHSHLPIHLLNPNMLDTCKV